jgi:type II secretory pathway pseudopilin PulG
VWYNQVDIYNVIDGSWSNATLSQARSYLAGTSVGSLVLFGGGGHYLNNVSNVVDIYNVTSNIWTIATLSQNRSNLVSTSVANRYALFAGGNIGPTSVSNVVDIYDSWNEIWYTATLSEARTLLAATSLGSLAFFGGGQTTSGNSASIVDIFNSTSQTWSTATLSQSRYFLAAASIGDIVAFGGGTPDTVISLSIVDMYNVTSGIWFTAQLSQARYFLAATSSINKIFFGGGNNASNFFSSSNVVDIFEIPSPSSLSPLSLSPFRLPSTPLSTIQSMGSSPINIPFSTTFPNPIVSNSSQMNSLFVIGIVVGIVALLIAGGLILFLILFIKRRKRKKKQNQQQNANNSMTLQNRETITLENDLNNDIVLNDADKTDMTMMTLSSYRPGTETLRNTSPGQIPFNELTVRKEIGQGTYGRVYVGKWKKYRVALKFCQNNGKIEEFMREANLIILLPPHPNVVRMYGVSIDGPQPIIVMEYCAGGSLDKLLYDREQIISNEQKLRWVYEIALGMSHLHKYNIVHRDLAARNILLSHSNLIDAHLKISDFGMSRVLQQNIEGRTLNPFGPIRWMAPESIRDQIYSKKSDLWMFGILVYEIAAQCEPHVDVDPNEVAFLIRDKFLKPQIPSDCPLELQEVMEMCWQIDPERRPSFEAICSKLEARFEKEQ